MMRVEVAVALSLGVSVLLVSCGGGGGGGGGGGSACTPSGLSDSAILTPPTGGPFAYSPPGGWLPGTATFPAVSGSYVDPVFGTTLWRITDEFPQQSFSDIYARNGWWNADASLFVHRTSTSQWFAINVATSGRIEVPDGTTNETSFDPVDPNVWYYYVNDALYQFNVATGNDQLVKTFPATVEELGASVDWIDRSGRYFLVAYSGELHVWDRSRDEIYTGSIQFNTSSGGWAGISPDGNYVVTATADFVSYSINHGTKQLATTGTMFWNLCGDHGDLISASDGSTYLMTFDCAGPPAVYRVDVTKPAGTQAQQRDQNKRLIETGFDDAGHFSCASSWPNQDWCFMSVEASDDGFADQGVWRPYKQEIVALQVVEPFSVRRLAHHRSRGMACDPTDPLNPLTCPHQGYYHQPRPSASWDGRRVAFLSNFGYNATPAAEYGDIYALEFCAP